MWILGIKGLMTTLLETVTCPSELLLLVLDEAKGGTLKAVT